MTEEGILELMNCENLSRLTLKNPKVSKEVILALARNKNLIEIQMDRAKFDSKELSEVYKIFAAERPNLKINISNY
jgi:hypothetical protein